MQQITSMPMYGESLGNKQILTIPSTNNPAQDEPADKNLQKHDDVLFIEQPPNKPDNNISRVRIDSPSNVRPNTSQNNNPVAQITARIIRTMASPTTPIGNPIEQTDTSGVDPNSSPIPPRHEKQRTPTSPELEPAASMVEVNLELMNQIEGHYISVEDRRGREHIWYNLPNLNSLPRRSSASLSYLSASQRKLRRANENGLVIDEDEIQSRLKATEERIASVPILTFNHFQVLQRGLMRREKPAIEARSL